MSKSKSGKTDLQRDILLTWYNNPNMTQKEITEVCDCSASYVSNVTNRFDNYDHMEAMVDQQDKELEQMFGDNIFQGDLGGDPMDGRGLIDIYSEQPDNFAGYLMKAAILLILLFVFAQMALVFL